jgi:hypothetical protein
MGLDSLDSSELTLTPGDKARSYAEAGDLTAADADLGITLTKAQLLGVLFAGRGLDGIEHADDPAALGRLLDLLDAPDPAFAVVTP